MEQETKIQNEEGKQSESIDSKDKKKPVMSKAGVGIAGAAMVAGGTGSVLGMDHHNQNPKSDDDSGAKMEEEKPASSPGPAANGTQTTHPKIAENVTDEMSDRDAWALARNEVGPGGVYEHPKGTWHNTYTEKEWSELGAEHKLSFTLSVPHAAESGTTHFTESDYQEYVYDVEDQREEEELLNSREVIQGESLSDSHSASGGKVDTDRTDDATATTPQAEAPANNPAGSDININANGVNIHGHVTDGSILDINLPGNTQAGTSLPPESGNNNATPVTNTSNLATGTTEPTQDPTQNAASVVQTEPTGVNQTQAAQTQAPGDQSKIDLSTGDQGVSVTQNGDQSNIQGSAGGIKVNVTAGAGVTAHADMSSTTANIGVTTGSDGTHATLSTAQGNAHVDVNRPEPATTGTAPAAATAGGANQAEVTNHATPDGAVSNTEAHEANPVPGDGLPGNAGGNSSVPASVSGSGAGSEGTPAGQPIASAGATDHQGEAPGIPAITGDDHGPENGQPAHAETPAGTSPQFPVPGATTAEGTPATTETPTAENQAPGTPEEHATPAASTAGAEQHTDTPAPGAPVEASNDGGQESHPIEIPQTGDPVGTHEVPEIGLPDDGGNPTGEIPEIGLPDHVDEPQAEEEPEIGLPEDDNGENGQSSHGSTENGNGTDVHNAEEHPVAFDDSHSETNHHDFNSHDDTTEWN